MSVLEKSSEKVCEEQVKENSCEGWSERQEKRERESCVSLCKQVSCRGVCNNDLL